MGEEEFQEFLDFFYYNVGYKMIPFVNEKVYSFLNHDDQLVFVDAIPINEENMEKLTALLEWCYHNDHTTKDIFLNSKENIEDAENHFSTYYSTFYLTIGLKPNYNLAITVKINQFQTDVLEGFDIENDTLFRLDEVIEIIKEGLTFNKLVYG